MSLLRGTALFTPMPEEWKPIVGFEGHYEVSSHGNVRSVARQTTVTRANGLLVLRRRVGKNLVAYENKARGGYRYVNLRINGQQYMRRVSCLVAITFIGPRPHQSDVCHQNGIETDDRLYNLRYDTKKNNAADKILHGTAPIGIQHPNAKLTAEDVLAIRNSQEDRKTLAGQFGVTCKHIDAIKARVKWRHLA